MAIFLTIFGASHNGLPFLKHPSVPVIDYLRCCFSILLWTTIFQNFLEVPLAWDWFFPYNPSLLETVVLEHTSDVTRVVIRIWPHFQVSNVMVDKWDVYSRSTFLNSDALEDCFVFTSSAPSLEHPSHTERPLAGWPHKHLKCKWKKNVGSQWTCRHGDPSALLHFGPFVAIGQGHSHFPHNIWSLYVYLIPYQGTLLFLLNDHIAPCPICVVRWA